MLTFNVLYERVNKTNDYLILLQTGGGHYSPVAAYHTGEDMTLILDVASFKYPHHWLPGKLLWEAMSQLDTTTQKTRGYIRTHMHYTV